MNRHSSIALLCLSDCQKTVIPRPVLRLVVGIRSQKVLFFQSLQKKRWVLDTDCHTSDIGHWFAMTEWKVFRHAHRHSSIALLCLFRLILLSDKLGSNGSANRALALPLGEPGLLIRHDSVLRMECREALRRRTAAPYRWAPARSGWRPAFPDGRWSRGPAASGGRSRHCSNAPAPWRQALRAWSPARS